MDNSKAIEPVEAEVAKMVEAGTVRVNLRALPRKYSEIKNEIAPEGERVKLRDLAGQTVVILSVRFFSGRYGIGAFVILADMEGQLYNTVVGHKVILPKLALIKDQLPVEATIVWKEGGSNEGYFDIE